MIQQKESEGSVYLSPEEFKIFNFLRSHSFDPSNAPTLEEIRKKFKFSSQDSAKKIIRTLQKKEGIDIFSKVERVGEDRVSRYFLPPETLEISVKKTKSREELAKENGQERNIRYGALYIAEPCFGTKAFDHEYVMKGLRLFLDVNHLARDVQQVVIQGGVIPHIPPYASKGNLTALKFLGYINRKPGEEKSASEIMLEEKILEIDDQFLADFYEKHVNNLDRRKITDLTDAFNVAGEQVKILMSAFSEDTDLRVQLGEEDKKNIGHIEDALIANWAKEKKEKIKADTQAAESRIYNLSLYSLCGRIEREFYESIQKRKDFLRKPEETRKAYKDRVLNDLGLSGELQGKFKSYLDTVRDHITEVVGRSASPVHLADTTSQEILKYLFWASYNPNKTSERITQKVRKLEEEESEGREEIDTLESKIEKFSEAIGWTERLLESQRASVTRFTRQYPVGSAEAETFWVVAKDSYTKHFFMWDIPQTPHVHVSNRKPIHVDTGVIENIGTGKTVQADVEAEEVVSNGKKLLLIHNIRSTFSDAVTPRSIRDAKLESNYQNLVVRKLLDSRAGDDRPDIILLGGHNGGGFRVMPWFKDTENLIEGEFVEGQEITYLINLPTLQSVERLDWLVSHNFSNWTTKRAQSGPNASGIVLHTEDKDYVNRKLVVDEMHLRQFGLLSEEIEVYRTNLGSAKSAAEKKALIKLIKEKKDEVKLHFKKIEVAGDTHLGAPDHPDRYSKDQFLRACQVYQREHGLPDIASWDEILHGVMEKTFNSAARYLGMSPEKFKQRVIEPILKDTTMDPEKKVYLIAKESLRNQRAITIHNDSEQKHLFNLLMKPYAEEIIRRGGKVILMSGNHYNSSIRTSDEARELANAFPESYRDDGKIVLFPGIGNPVGVGAMRLPNGEGAVSLPGKRVLFGMHKFPERQDELYGIITHLRKGNVNADVVVAGDRHQPGIAYADNHAIVLHPGMEPINAYVPFIGKPAGVRGIINVEYDPQKRGVYAFSFVLNPTLEKIIKRDNIL